ncbi:MAG: hypothetical protein K9J21_06915 [Bacteroidales bacterium]|nr:hypothetical protein [Bacteroidales bacterium]
MIDNNIKPNDNEEITGDVMNSVLQNMLANLPLKPESGLSVYDPALEYSPGATCIYNNQIFMCYSNTTGTWNPSHWKMASNGIVVNNISERDGLTNRFRGMIVTVDNGVNPAVRYQLQGGTANSNWYRIGDQQYLRLDLEIDHYRQVSFNVPTDIASAKLFLNSIQTEEFSISETTLTWENETINLEVDDKLTLYYKLK